MPTTSDCPSPELPKLLKAKEAAAVLAISTRSLWRLTASGELPKVQIGDSVRYHPVALAEFIERQTKNRPI